MEIESKQIGLVSDVLQAMARCFDERVHQPFIVIGATARDIISIFFKMLDIREFYELPQGV